MGQRKREVEAWLASLPELPAGCEALTPVTGDAGLRCYWRLRLSDGATRIVMDAASEPDPGPMRSFVQLSRRLADAGLQVPRVLAYDPQKALLLLSDLGERRYLEELRDERASELYDAAIQALLRMQREVRGTGLPLFDATELRREMKLFYDWLLQAHLGIRVAGARARLWRATETLLVDSALAQPQVFVHRDYHSRNLLHLPGGPGILDFQDAVCGPLSYDLVSLLKDCYITWPEARVQGWALDYLEQARQEGPDPRMDTEEFLLRFDLMGAQRHLKAAGIFCRLWLRDKKPGYLKALPRTVGYIAELGERRPKLQSFAHWLRDEILPALERLPCAP